MLCAFLASALLTFNYLHRNSYPLFSAESLALWAGIFLLFAVLSLLFKIWKADWIFYAALTVAILDLAVGLEKILFDIPWVMALSLGGAALSGLFFIFRSHVEKILATALVFALASGLILNVLDPVDLYRTRSLSHTAGIAGKAPVFIFILDEHSGLAGFPAEFEETRSLRTELRDRYHTLGFRTHTSAYANFGGTFDSIPTFMNGRIDTAKTWLKGASLKENGLLKKLSDEGYAIHLYESTHLLFENAPGLNVARVMTYQESSAGYLRGLRLGFRARRFVLVNNFFESHRSALARKLFRILWRRPKEASGVFMTGSLATRRVLEQIQKDVLDSRGHGGVFLTHFLNPHSHYIYNENGDVVDPDLWEPCRSDEIDSDGSVNTKEDRRRKYRKYAAQTRYLHSELSKFFEFLKENGLYERATIVLAGDHGSRISRLDPIERQRGRLSVEDYTDTFSSFLAIKSTKPGGVVTAPTASTLVFGDLFDILPEDPRERQALEWVYLPRPGKAGSFTAVRMPSISFND